MRAHLCLCVSVCLCVSRSVVECFCVFVAVSSDFLGESSAVTGCVFECVCLCPAVCKCVSGCVCECVGVCDRVCVWECNGLVGR